MGGGVLKNGSHGDDLFFTIVFFSTHYFSSSTLSEFFSIFLPILLLLLLLCFILISSHSFRFSFHDHPCSSFLPTHLTPLYLVPPPSIQRTFPSPIHPTFTHLPFYHSTPIPPSPPPPSACDGCYGLVVEEMNKLQTILTNQSEIFSSISSTPSTTFTTRLNTALAQAAFLNQFVRLLCHKFHVPLIFLFLFLLI